jgi:hypothetical protein
MTRKRFVKVCREAGYSEEWIGALIDMAHKRYKSYQKRNQLEPMSLLLSMALCCA